MHFIIEERKMGEYALSQQKTITVRYGKKSIELDVDAVIYAQMARNYAQIHFSETEHHRIRITFGQLQELLGPEYVQVKRGCLVRAREIQQISDMVYLKNGQALDYVVNQKKELVEQVCEMLRCPPEEILGKTTKALSVEKNGSPEPENSLREEPDCLSLLVGRKEVKLPIRDILYIRITKGVAHIHVSSGEIFTTRSTHCALQRILGDRFIFIGNNCLVSGVAIHSVGKKLELCNGEELDYSQRRRQEILRFMSSWKRRFIDSLEEESAPKSFEEYEQYYRCFRNASFAFTDIEMVFDENQQAIDWIFRYGNQELSKIEKLPLKNLIGNSFGSLFANMDSKWLRSYEQAVLYGRTLKIADYSPEVDTNLVVICFPTFKGHCGCILFNAEELPLMKLPGC